ncbi:MAG TPA: diaminopimelate epimerase, partial [Tepidisphaeraceae bacterium]|nr:diaminopimelate epimerase [Tepidisphaeraceae bacterium]
GDGLILILPSDKADVRMRMFNADGGESEMCGNGIRCVAKYAFDHGLSKSNPMRVETGRGVLTLSLDVVDWKVQTVTVDMDEPMLGADAVHADTRPGSKSRLCRKVGDHEHELAMAFDDGRPVVGTFVSMGNPHIVIFVDEVDSIPLEVIGPEIENFPAFTKRINVHFVQVISKDHLKMRTWERGSGITLACGTGACAVLVASVVTNRSDRTAQLDLPGGSLQIRWDEKSNHVFMTGPAVEVFRGEWAG